MQSRPLADAGASYDRAHNQVVKVSMSCWREQQASCCCCRCYCCCCLLTKFSFSTHVSFSDIARSHGKTPHMHRVLISASEGALCQMRRNATGRTTIWFRRLLRKLHTGHQKGPSFSVSVDKLEILASNAGVCFADPHEELDVFPCCRPLSEERNGPR